jgi:hypothetical protein
VRVGDGISTLTQPERLVEIPCLPLAAAAPGVGSVSRMPIPPRSLPDQ